MIKSFTGKNRFLSNFYLCDVEVEGLIYPHTESAFQAMKLLNNDDRKQFQNLTPQAAKKLWKKIPLRSDWEEIKNNVMYQVCKAKFEQNPDLMDLLIATGNQELQEGNRWGDTYWGVCKGEGQNMLGKILMRIRDEHR